MSLTVALRDALLRAVPDVPIHVELRALLTEPDTLIAGEPDAAFLYNAQHFLAVAWGAAPHALIADVLDRATRPPGAILSAARLPYPNHGYRWEPATIYVRPGKATPLVPSLPPNAALSLLTQAELARVPDALADELARALGRGPVVCARVDDALVSFAYAPHRSDRFFDLSVDTLPEFRGQGLGRSVAARLIALERQRGREPVWGAIESNLPSIAVARALGFSPHGLLWVATPE